MLTYPSDLAPDDEASIWAQTVDDVIVASHAHLVAPPACVTAYLLRSLHNRRGLYNAIQQLAPAAQLATPAQMSRSLKTAQALRQVDQHIGTSHAEVHRTALLPPLPGAEA